MKIIELELSSDVEQMLKTIRRDRNDFILEAIREKINKKQVINKVLKEGYQATAEEDLATTKDFEPADLEDWK